MTEPSVCPPAPPGLGRGVVIGEGDPVPAPWAGVLEVVLDAHAVDDPAAAVARLHRAWLGREPVVIRLRVDPQRFRPTETWSGEPYQLRADFTPWHDRLHFLVWANNYDGRRPERLVWAWTEVAVRDHGLRRITDGAGDIRLADGRPAWLDGGPRQTLPDLGMAVVHQDSLESGALGHHAPGAAPLPEGLAPDQMAAVLHARGPARVVAPAGSGKTRVLTARLRHLLTERGYERESVLAVAYNVRARQEMEQRTTDFRPRVQTLNSLGYEIVRDLRGATGVVSGVEVRRLLEPLLPDLDWRVNTDPLRTYVDALGEVRQRLRPPQLVETGNDELKGLAGAFPRFRRALLEGGVVDYDEQLYAAVEGLLGDAEFRRRWQKRCRHLLVDEFQDLTPLHMLLIRLLALPALDVFGVGDDDQVLYSYAGADPRFLIDYARLFPGAAEYALQVNCRCPAPVVEAAVHLLSRNRLRVSKEIRAREGAPDGEASFRMLGYSQEAAMACLLGAVRGWLAEPGIAPCDVAVLTRVNATLLAPQVALLEAGIPVNSTLEPQLLDRTGIRTALAYLRLAQAGARMASDDLVLVYRRPDRRLPAGFAEILRRRTHWTVAELRHAPLGPHAQPKLDRLVGDLSLLQGALGGGARSRQLLKMIRERVGLGTAMAKLDAGQVGELSGSHIDDLEALEQVAALHPEPEGFESWLRRTLRSSRDPEGVVLATVHKTKGQEWPCVCVYAANEGLMPHRLALPDGIEEERRIMHVGLTRGRERVLILAAQANPSRFLGELLGPPPLVAEPAPAASAPALAPRSRPTSSIRGGAEEIQPRIGEQLTLSGGYAGTVSFVDLKGVWVRLANGTELQERWGERAERAGVRGVLTRPV